MGVAFIQCGKNENPCSQSNWIGTYIFQAENECIMDTTNQEEVNFVDTIVFTANNDPNKITWGMYQYNLDDCFFGNIKASLTLEEDIIIYRIGDCSANYLKID